DLVRRPPSGKNPAGGLTFCCSLCSPLCDWSRFDACLWFTDCEVASCASGHEVAGVVPRCCSALCVVNAVCFAGADARQCELAATSVGDSVLAYLLRSEFALGPGATPPPFLWHTPHPLSLPYPHPLLSQGGGVPS